MIIFGIDTALRSTGYGIIKVEGRRVSAVDCGVIKNKKKSALSECLRRLAGGIQEIIDLYHPDIAALEGGFYFRNAQTAMVLGMARGTVVSILAQSQIPTYEYAPRRAKQAVVGYGNASKQQVAFCMAESLQLNVTEIPNDSTDAMAVAMCHALTQQYGQGIHLPTPL